MDHLGGLGAAIWGINILGFLTTCSIPPPSTPLPPSPRQDQPVTQPLKSGRKISQRIMEIIRNAVELQNPCGGSQVLQAIGAQRFEIWGSPWIRCFSHGLDELASLLNPGLTGTSCLT